MTEPHPRIATPFPPPPDDLESVLDILRVRRHGDPDQKARAGNLDLHYRPWDPASCPGELRDSIWTWCDEVAAWINREYNWRPAQMIPPCWPQHPHIARELAVLAVLHWEALDANTPGPLEEWHRLSLPGFSQRMIDRLGDSSCRNGNHADWLAESRYTGYFEEVHAKARRHSIDLDAIADARSDRAESPTTTAMAADASLYKARMRLG